MTIIQTKDLAGAQLDWAVAKAEGHRIDDYEADNGSNIIGVTAHGFTRIIHGGSTLEKIRYGTYQPSTEWLHAGPIIEREMLGTMPVSDAWWRAGDVDGANGYGPTPLVAAMRCYVAAKLGDQVDVPEVLA